MDTKPEDTDLDLLRDSLLMQAQRGEITPAQAEEMAAAKGLGPFASRPALPRFDPKLKSHWSIVMAVAWIAWRDFELVREQDPEFCSEHIYWLYREWNERPHKGAKPVKRRGYFLEPRHAPTVGRLARMDGVARIRRNVAGNVASTAVMTIREAQAALWGAFSEDLLRTLGFNAEGAVVEFPARDWAYIRLHEEGGRDVLRYEEAHSRAEPFTAVKLRQSDLLRLWPAAAAEFSALPATVIDKGGRPPEYDWAAMKAFTLRTIKDLGRPHRNNKRLPSKAQLIELIIDTWAEQFNQHPSPSSVRSHVNKWLTEPDGN